MKISRILTTLLVPLAALAAASCSVKEDRWECPCWLVFEPQEGARTGGDGGFHLSVYRDGSLIKELTTEVSWESVRTDSYDVSVSKGEKQMSILEGLSRSHISGTALLITEGEQADSVYAHSVFVDCNREEAVVPVESNKQFATVFLRMEDGGAGTYPYGIRVTGGIDGLDLLTLEPHRGPFSYSCPPFSTENEFRFRLPRQTDGSLQMELIEKGASDPSPVDVIPLGEYIIESGFDWGEKSLQDIYIGVDYARAGIRIRVNDWETVWTVTEKI